MTVSLKFIQILYCSQYNRSFISSTVIHAFYRQILIPLFFRKNIYTLSGGALRDATILGTNRGKLTKQDKKEQANSNGGKKSKECKGKDVGEGEREATVGKISADLGGTTVRGSCDAVPGGKTGRGSCNAVPGKTTGIISCDAVPDKTTGSSSCDAVPDKTTSRSSCDAVPGGNTDSSSNIEAVPGKTTGSSSCDAVSGKTTGSDSCDAFPGETVFSSSCDAVPGETTVSSSCDAVPGAAVDSSSCDAVDRNFCWDSGVFVAPGDWRDLAAQQSAAEIVFSSSVAERHPVHAVPETWLYKALEIGAVNIWQTARDEPAVPEKSSKVNLDHAKQLEQKAQQHPPVWEVISCAVVDTELETPASLADLVRQRTWNTIGEEEDWPNSCNNSTSLISPASWRSSSEDGGYASICSSTKSTSPEGVLLADGEGEQLLPAVPSCSSDLGMKEVDEMVVYFLEDGTEVQLRGDVKEMEVEESVAVSLPPEQSSPPTSVSRAERLNFGTADRIDEELGRKLPREAR